MRGSYKLTILAALALITSGCDRMMTPRGKQIIRDADTKAAEGDYATAITLYEQALDASTAAADIHYKLAVLYDDKMSDPLNAIHHFKRYLVLAPAGARAPEVKSFIKRDEVALATSLSGDSIVTRGDAARLRNENLALRKELEAERAKGHLPASEKTPAHAKKTSSKKRATPSSH